VVVLKALYGMLIASLLWYQKFREDLESIGFKFNIYDPCVANRMINNKQHTIRFHVDDILSSHVDSEVNDGFLQWLNKMYGSVKEVSAKRGDVHKYLGMIIDFRSKGKVKFRMDDYVVDMLNEFPSKVGSKDTASTPASSGLFDDKNSKLLDHRKKEQFHTFVAKCLFLSKRARPDIQLTVAVLSTRVKGPTNQDWLRLERLMKYLNGTRTFHLTLGIDDVKVIKWYVDASYGVHPDLRSHTGSIMTMGTGAVQNLITSTLTLLTPYHKILSIHVTDLHFVLGSNSTCRIFLFLVRLH